MQTTYVPTGKGGCSGEGGVGGLHVSWTPPPPAMGATLEEGLQSLGCALNTLLFVRILCYPY